MTQDMQIENLWWRYKGSKNWILKGINLEVEKGEFIGITGPSGAGKTTLCMCMNGLIPQRSQGEMKGRVLIKGMDTKTTPLFNIVQRVGMVFQDPETQFVTMSVEDEVAFPLENFSFTPNEMKKRVEWALRVVHMEKYSKKYPFELSGGEKQRVIIASGLALKPEILILDEPTSDLDPMGKSEVFSVISELKKEFNMTLIVVEHLTEELVKYADRLVLVYNGEIIRQAPPNKFFEDVDFLKDKGVYPPQTTEFYYQIRKQEDFHQKLPITIREGVKTFPEVLKKITKPKAQTQKTRQKTPRTQKPGEIIIGTRNLVYTYPDGNIAIDGIDLEIRRGEYVAIIGQNGSGKTTLVKHFVGLLKPTGGVVEVFGKDTRSLSISGLATKVAYTFQNPDHQLFCERVYDECAYGPRNLGLPNDEAHKRVQEALEAVGLTGLEEEPPFFLGKGQRQRLSVASVLTMKPDVIIVDEPTTGQDMRQSEGIMSLLDKLNNEGRTIIIITHNMRIVAEHTIRTIVLCQGKVLLDGPTSEVFSKPTILEKTFLTPPQITQLAQALNPYGFPKDILTVEEMLEVCNQLKREGLA